MGGVLGKSGWLKRHLVASGGGVLTGGRRFFQRELHLGVASRVGATCVVALFLAGLSGL